MKYSYGMDRSGIVFAGAKEINASFKDLCAVCDAVRYQNVPRAIGILDGVINKGMAIEYRRHNKYMGSRHELGGKKGRFPKKCAALVRDVIINAAANATNLGSDPDMMYIVHAAANKTIIVQRAPPKGVRAVGGSRPSVRRSNLEYAKIEIGISEKDAKGLGARMQRALKATSRHVKPKDAPPKRQPEHKPKEQPKGQHAAKEQMKPLAAPVHEKRDEAKAGGDANKV